MCSVSMVGDYWTNKTFPTKYPNGGDWIDPIGARVVTYPTMEQFNALKKDVEELKKLLLAAKRYDEQVGEPDCEVEDKVALIKKIAELVGVDLKEVFG